MRDQELTYIGQGAFIEQTGSDHKLMMRTFQVLLKKARKSCQPRLRFDLEKLTNPDVAGTFHATIAGKFSSLIGLRVKDMTWTSIP